MGYTQYIQNNGILGMIRRAGNYVDPRLMNHGFRVAYLVSILLRRLGTYDELAMRDRCVLAMLHDIGAYKTEEIDRMLEFETGTGRHHSIYGYLFLKSFSPLQDLAAAILFHHTPWNKLVLREDVSAEEKLLAQVIQIADGFDLFLESNHDSWAEFTAFLKERRGTVFQPELVDLVLTAPLAASIALTANADEVYREILRSVPFTPAEIQSYLEMIVFMIDFRSRYTVTHTITTSSISYELARQLGLTKEEKNQIVCGAMLHDLGKIGVPVEILEYPGRLSPQAMEIMKKHVERTGIILGEAVPEPIRRIALRHHEKLDGSGYPLGLNQGDLTLPERIVATADIVSALTGQRSYKDAYEKEQVVGILSRLGQEGKIDLLTVDLMVDHFDEIMAQTTKRCRPILDLYDRLQIEYGKLEGTEL